MSRGDGGAAFKVGDRVEVIDAEGCEEWYSNGSTGTIRQVCPDGYWIDFDPPFGKLRPSGSRDWFASGKRLRLLTTTNNPQPVTAAPKGVAGELLPCPFCGSEPMLLRQRVAEDCVETWVACGNCFASTDRAEGAYSEPEMAAAMWNQRTERTV